MKDRYTQIKFIAANYSRLQGLRIVPIGMLVLFTAIWNNDRQGDLSGLILSVLATILLYWLADRYYNQAFGQVVQTPAQRKRDLISSVTFGILAMLAFVLDTAEILPISMLGVVFAGALFMDFWWATLSVRGEAIVSFPENFIASILILILSLLPIFGISWWEAIGFKAQTEGMLAVDGIALILAGIWGHIRVTHDLSVVEAKSNDHAL